MELPGIKIKQKLDSENKFILLLEIAENKLLPKESISNVIAIDSNNRTIWEIEPPTTKYDFYEKIFFTGKEFYALTGGGQLHHIDEETGKIISSKIMK